jgi:dCTP deaminase
MVKSDKWIKEMALKKKMIEPFASEQIRHGISFGLSSYGYDFRLSRRFKIFDPVKGGVLDPKNFAHRHFRDFEGDVCEIPPNSYILGQSLEYFRIPRSVITICYGKSTYARCGIYVNVTPFEPEWDGFATVAIMNTTRLPARVYAGEGIGQIIFLSSDEICHVSYADKKGKYQSQKEITLAKGKG